MSLTQENYVLHLMEAPRGRLCRCVGAVKKRALCREGANHKYHQTPIPACRARGTGSVTLHTIKNVR